MKRHLAIAAVEPAQKPTMCRDCGAPIKSRPHGIKVICAACKKAAKAKYEAKWFMKHRQKNSTWRAINKRRAKAWRAKNSKHIIEYRKRYYLGNEVGAP